MWVLGLVLMIDQIDQNIVRGVIPQLQDEFGINDAQIGLLLSVFVLVNGLITVPAGYLADRWRRTRAIGHTVVAWSALTVVTAAAQNFVQLVGLRGLLGFGQAITEPSANTLIADYYPTSHRGRAFSLQQVLTFAGVGIGVGLGGVLGSALGWRWAFVIVAAPGTLIALAVYALTEPKRGASDRLHLGVEDEEEEVTPPLFEHGFRRFVRDMIDGLIQDFRTIMSIKTLRLSLIGVGVLLFTIFAVGAWLHVFYQRFSGLTQEESTLAFMALVLFGGIPGILLGGRLADRYTTKIQGARVVIPAYCIFGGNLLFGASYFDMPFGARFGLEVVGFFVITMAIPALRAGLTDVVPANLRGAGFGAFNLVSVVFGAALAPLLVGVLADVWNLRVAFMIVSPPVFVGAYILYRARYHLDEDAAKIFEAVLKAVQEAQAREEESQAERARMHAAAGNGSGEEAELQGTPAPATAPRRESPD